jgi:uncharacterized protein (TIGR00725 family)
MSLHRGRAYYFCCDACRARFDADPGRYRDEVDAKQLTIGVMGSASRDVDSPANQRAMQLGGEIAKRGLILITGACPGLPHACAKGARKEGGLSVGISPALSLEEHVQHYHSPFDAFDVLIYTGSGLMGREVTNIRSSDMVVIADGRSGTLGEFAIAYDEGKLIGVLEGSGGISDQIPGIVDSIAKDTGAVLIYERDPAELLERMLQVYVSNHFRQPSCFFSNPEKTSGSGPSDDTGK